jgi:hypothetical protein
MHRRLVPASHTLGGNRVLLCQSPLSDPNDTQPRQGQPVYEVSCGRRGHEALGRTRNLSTGGAQRGGKHRFEFSIGDRFR